MLACSGNTRCVSPPRALPQRSCRATIETWCMRLIAASRVGAWLGAGGSKYLLHRCKCGWALLRAWPARPLATVCAQVQSQHAPRRWWGCSPSASSASVARAQVGVQAGRLPRGGTHLCRRCACSHARPAEGPCQRVRAGKRVAGLLGGALDVLPAAVHGYVGAKGACSPPFLHPAAAVRGDVSSACPRPLLSCRPSLDLSGGQGGCGAAAAPRAQVGASRLHAPLGLQSPWLAGCLALLLLPCAATVIARRCRCAGHTSAPTKCLCCCRDEAAALEEEGVLIDRLSCATAGSSCSSSGVPSRHSSVGLVAVTHAQPQPWEAGLRQGRGPDGRDGGERGRLLGGDGSG